MARRARRGAERLQRIARRADELGELLGEDHDLAVLDAWIAGHSGRRQGAQRIIGRRTAKDLRGLIARRRRKLHRRALRDGRALYGERPKRFVARVDEAWAATRRD